MNTEMNVLYNLGRGRFKLRLELRHHLDVFFRNRKAVVQRGQILLYRAVDDMNTMVIFWTRRR